MRAAGEPVVRQAAPDRETAPLIAAASADASPGATSQPFSPGRTLSGIPPAADATTARRCAIASSVTSELPS